MLYVVKMNKTTVLFMLLTLLVPVALLLDWWPTWFDVILVASASYFLLHGVVILKTEQALKEAVGLDYSNSVKWRVGWYPGMVETIFLGDLPIEGHDDIVIKAIFFEGSWHYYPKYGFLPHDKKSYSLWTLEKRDSIDELKAMISRSLEENNSRAY